MWCGACTANRYKTFKQTYGIPVQKLQIFLYFDTYTTCKKILAWHVILARVVFALMWPRHHAVENEASHTASYLRVQMFRSFMDEPTTFKVATSPTHPMAAADHIHAVEQDTPWYWSLVPPTAASWPGVILKNSFTAFTVVKDVSWILEFMDVPLVSSFLVLGVVNPSGICRIISLAVWGFSAINTILRGSTHRRMSVCGKIFVFMATSLGTCTSTRSGNFVPLAASRTRPGYHLPSCSPQQRLPIQRRPSVLSLSP